MTTQDYHLESTDSLPFQYAKEDDQLVSNFRRTAETIFLAAALFSFSGLLTLSLL